MHVEAAGVMSLTLEKTHWQARSSAAQSVDLVAAEEIHDAPQGSRASVSARSRRSNASNEGRGVMTAAGDRAADGGK